jgi:hypothetical protein
MYLRMDEDTELVEAVHWPASGLEAHRIVHAPSPQHGYQTEYLGNAAEAFGHRVTMEEYLPTGVKPDLLISGRGRAVRWPPAVSRRRRTR